MAPPRVFDVDGVRYELAPELASVRLSTERAPPGAVFHDEELKIAVVQRDGESSHVLSPFGPVYRAEGVGNAGPIAVPTGRLFVRFAEGVDAENRAPALSGVGLRVEQLVEWAPHTAWCVAADGNVEHALARLSDARKLPDVVNAEPELLRPRVFRGR
jgi:hypothetical protein